MKIYNLIYWDSAAWNLKYSLKLKKKKENIIVFSDDLSIWPIKNYLSSKWKEKRNRWILKDLFKYWRDEYYDDFKIYLKESEKTFLNELVKINKDDKIILWYWENTQDKLFLWYVLNLLKEFNNIYMVNISDFSFFPSENFITTRSIAEMTPDLLIDFIWKELPFDNQSKELSRDSFIKLTKLDWNLRQLVWESIININENFYDSMIFDSISTSYKKAANIIWKTLWKSYQIINDVFIEYRINCLIEQWILKFEWNRKYTNEYSVRLNLDLFRNFDETSIWNFDWQNASQTLPKEWSEVLIWLKINDNEWDLHKIVIPATFQNKWFTDTEFIKRFPLIIQKESWVFTWKYLEEFPNDF